MELMITLHQIKAARAILDLGHRELAKLADMSPSTIARIERGEDVRVATLTRIQSVFEARGLEFPDFRTIRMTEEIARRGPGSEGVGQPDEE